MRNMMLTFCLALCLGGCVSRQKETEIVYARPTQPNAKTEGFMRIAQEDPVAVTVDGHDTAFQRRSLSGFLVIAEEDLVRLIENTAELVKIKRAASADGK
jgi:hypothetical protein